VEEGTESRKERKRKVHDIFDFSCLRGGRKDSNQLYPFSLEDCCLFKIETAARKEGMWNFPTKEEEKEANFRRSFSPAERTEKKVNIASTKLSHYFKLRDIYLGNGGMGRSRREEWRRVCNSSLTFTYYSKSATMAPTVSNRSIPSFALAWDCLCPSPEKTLWRTHPKCRGYLSFHPLFEVEFDPPLPRLFVLFLLLLLPDPR